MKKKIILAQGLVFEEEQEKLRLEKLAHEGWLFESVAWGGLGWRLVRGEPQFRQYEFDYLPSDPAEADSDPYGGIDEAGVLCAAGPRSVADQSGSGRLVNRTFVLWT